MSRLGGVMGSGCTAVSCSRFGSSQTGGMRGPVTLQAVLGTEKHHQSISVLISETLHWLFGPVTVAFAHEFCGS